MALEFLRRLMAPDAGKLAPEDARAAVASVLVMAARSDARYQPAEIAAIDAVLIHRYGLDAAGATALRAQGEAAEAEAIDHYQFTKAIKQAIPLEDRVAVLEALWRVILVDETRDPHEDALMRQLVDRLGLSEMDSALARRRAAAS